MVESTPFEEDVRTKMQSRHINRPVLQEHAIEGTPDYNGIFERENYRGMNRYNRESIVGTLRRVTITICKAQPKLLWTIIKIKGKYLQL